ncbi:hypothetical protein ABZV93_04545 [Actinopolymorpha sp. NPDC004070]|uniref:hypothetical protein n=1 Tax=Actinopolymorpha sp. NPDC004070 TaxID=3154548 RepID=UPI0033BE3105
MSALTDGQARRIAAEWHGGQWTAMYSLASAGYLDRDRLHAEIASELRIVPTEQGRQELLALDAYVRHRTDTSTVPGWPLLWDETPVQPG